MKYKWIFFDLDNTLWDFTAASGLAIRQIYDVTPELQSGAGSFENFDRIYHQINALMWPLYEEGLTDVDSLKTERFRLAINPADKSEEIYRRCMEINDLYLGFLACRNLALPGALQTLEYLSSGHKIGVITNGFIDSQANKLKYSGLWDFISLMIISEEVGVAKPGIEIYQEALRQAGCKPGEALMIGDNLNSDIHGALNAGIDTVYLRRNNAPEASEEIKNHNGNARLIATIGELNQLTSGTIDL